MLINKDEQHATNRQDVKIKSEVQPWPRSAEYRLIGYEAACSRRGQQRQDRRRDLWRQPLGDRCTKPAGAWPQSTRCASGGVASGHRHQIAWRQTAHVRLRCKPARQRSQTHRAPGAPRHTRRWPPPASSFRFISAIAGFGRSRQQLHRHDGPSPAPALAASASTTTNSGIRGRPTAADGPGRRASARNAYRHRPLSRPPNTLRRSSTARRET